MNALESLSDYCGIVASFVDARDVVQTASPRTRAALLAAMGIEATDEASARVSLEALRAQEIEQALPPVYVHYQTAGAIKIDVNLGTAPQAKGWQLDLESGATRRGTLKERPSGVHAKNSSSRQWTLRIDEELPCGYHTLTLDKAARCSLIVTPGECWLPERIMSGEKLWGVAAQLYLLRSRGNWGIGDYSDLKQLLQLLAARGADVVGVNPLHALFVDDPEQASPYSPASRLLLNVLNIDVGRVADSMHCTAVMTQISSSSFQQALARCRNAQLVDYSGVAALKLPILQNLFACCDRAASEWREFLSFRAACGDAFEKSCLFLALRLDFAQQSAASSDWHQWPEEYRNAESPATQHFAQERAEAVTFQAWLQFIADSQLQQCRAAADGMAVGLYRDLAVGADSSGAETWANQRAVIDTAQVGAPPDIYNPQGQDWGLPPFNPRALRAEGYRSFIELLRANMRHAGGLRIDHIMALKQLYWIPKGYSPADGAYVRYPLEDLVGILALESQRHRCLVVGEDLGTVPEGFRERMQSANILSYRVLFFEKDTAGFRPPDEYPRLALAVAGSHDLPTLRAWWRGEDLALKERLHLYPTEAHALQARNERDADRSALEQLLRDHNLVASAQLDEELFVEAAHSFLAGSAAAAAILQLDDLTGELDPVNVPTTSHEHPNWRRRFAVSLEQLPHDSRFVSATASLNERRRFGA